MTTKEAIGIIKGHKIFAVGKYDWSDAFDLAVEALEKQIPKELESCGFGIGKGWCSYCHREIDYDHKYESDGWNFCPNCGQAINWENV